MYRTAGYGLRKPQMPRFSNRDLIARSSRPDVFCKRGVLRNFAKLTRKHVRQSLRPATLLQKSLCHRYFPVNFMKFLRTPIFIEHLWWLLLNCTEMAKYTCGLKHKIQCKNLAKQFTLHSAEAYSEPFPTSKQGGYLVGGNYFHKKVHLRCLKRF